jgi:hypothetical protein
VQFLPLGSGVADGQPHLFRCRCRRGQPSWATHDERDPKVTTALSTGYLTFVYHRFVVQLMEGIIIVYGNAETENCLVLPTPSAAERCQAFLRHATTPPPEDVVVAAAT